MCLMYDVEDSNLGGETSSYLNSYLYCLRREIEEPQWIWKALREGKQKVGAAGVHGAGGRAVAAFTS